MSGAKPRLAPWLRRRIPAGQEFGRTRAILERYGLNTVCDGASCPNQGECYGRGTATFMILGSRCTRDCRFCGVPHGDVGPVAEGEAERVAEAAAALGLRYVVVTSVTRDDLPDGGAAYFARTVRAVKAAIAGAAVEVLVPDFEGRRADVRTVVEAAPDVFGHNVETVPRLYDLARPQADYGRSLDVLRMARDDGAFLTKSGLMLGLGETREEVLTVLGDLRGVGCDAVTLGQYLAPSGAHVPVAEFIRPEVFDGYAAVARQMGFKHAAAGPFVRSSYRAEEILTGVEP